MASELLRNVGRGETRVSAAWRTGAVAPAGRWTAGGLGGAQWVGAPVDGPIAGDDDDDEDGFDGDGDFDDDEEFEDDDEFEDEDDEFLDDDDEEGDGDDDEDDEDDDL